MAPLQLADLDRYIGWSLVGVRVGAAGTIVRLRSAVGELVDIGLVGAVRRMTADDVPRRGVRVRDCVNSPTGEHALRPKFIERAPGSVQPDPTQVSCILCGRADFPAES